MLNEQNKDKQAEQRDEINVPASNLELFKMRYEIEIRIREAQELIGYTGKTRTSLMQPILQKKMQALIDPQGKTINKNVSYEAKDKMIHFLERQKLTKITAVV